MPTAASVSAIAANTPIRNPVSREVASAVATTSVIGRMLATGMFGSRLRTSFRTAAATDNGSPVVRTTMKALRTRLPPVTTCHWLCGMKNFSFTIPVTPLWRSSATMPTTVTMGLLMPPPTRIWPPMTSFMSFQ